jgi:hypothetical protein
MNNNGLCILCVRAVSLHCNKTDDVSNLSIFQPLNNCYLLKFYDSSVVRIKFWFQKTSIADFDMIKQGNTRAVFYGRILYSKAR